MKNIVITSNALGLLATIDFSIESIILGDIDDQLSGHVILKYREASVILSTRACTSDSRLLVIRQWEGGLFNGVPDLERRSVFDRCARLALQEFDRRVSLNPRWLPYHHGNRISIFANFYGRDEGGSKRLIAEVNADNTPHVYIFELEEVHRALELSQFRPDYEAFQNAVSDYVAASNEPLAVSPQVGGNGSIELERIDDLGIDTRGLSFDEWVARLSPKQRDFYTRDLSQPIRLRGAAGTGKTIAMVLKAIKTRRDASESSPTRILFLTHSWAMAEKVDRLVCELDPDPPHSSILVCPLLTIAQKRDYRAIGREPLGMDSDEGKVKGISEVCITINAFLSSEWITFKSRCSEKFANTLEADQQTSIYKRFQWDLFIEFGCILSAQGMLGRDSDLEKYLKIKRLQWMMQLDTAEDKRAVFSLWKRFLRQLREKSIISTDQMISDALSEYSTFFWEAARGTQGFDAVFVDEMHLFNSQERMIFHHLLSDGDSSPVVLMALDPKQSPREVYTEVSEAPHSSSYIYEQAKLPNSTRIDLTTVYRYSPEIFSFIKTILDAAPGLDLNDDWNVPIGDSALQSGPKPKLIISEDIRDTLKTVLSLVDDIRPSVSRRKGRVAVLCIDHEKFGKYKDALIGQRPNEVIVISSRDDVEKLQHAPKRFVYSAPEYVAGLQFDTVIVVDVNKNLVPDGGYAGHQTRSFLSELYLGVSRAEKHLIIVASKEGGGVSPFLHRALAEGILVGSRGPE